MESDRQKMIEARAYGLWEEAGGLHGMQEEHWRQAEREYDEAATGVGAGQTSIDEVKGRPTEDVTSLSPRGGNARQA